MMEWRPIPGFPAYMVSEVGDVKRVTGGARGQVVDRVLRGSISTAGYRYHDLYLGGCVGRRIFTHRIVCEAFHGPAPSEKHQVAHGDGTKLNNHFSNLRWATRTENEADKLIHGTRPMGDQHWIRRRRKAALKFTRREA